MGHRRQSECRYHRCGSSTLIQDDPYVRAGLRHNPFKLEPPGALADALYAELDRNPLACPKPGNAMVYELVGPKGAGKSTQLLRWREAHAGPYHHVPEGWARWRKLPTGPITYWDEAYRAPPVLLRMALARARVRNYTIVVAGHQSIAAAVRKANMRLEHHEFPRLTTAAVQAFFMRRVRAAALDGCVPDLELPESTAQKLALAAGASLRAVSDALHIWVAQQVGQ